MTFPKLLLFDEIDAPLHPSMTRTLFDVIEGVLVKEKGVSVILTTHSPSSVALAPEHSTFLIDKENPRISGVTKDRAIQLLSSGLVTVTSGTRLIITEAKFDQIVYQSIFNALVERGASNAEPPLVFLGATNEFDKEGGGSAQVQNWATKLPEAGMTSVFGIIDRDKSNQGSHSIRVIGRYSLENYLLDPILVYALLLDKNEHLSIIDLGISNCDIHQLEELGSDLLQAAVDKTVEKVEATRPQLRSKATFQVRYLNGVELNLPDWIRDERGHDLVTIFFNTFKANGVPLIDKRLEQLNLILTVKLPGFIPTDLAETLRSLQSI